MEVCLRALGKPVTPIKYAVDFSNLPSVPILSAQPAPAQAASSDAEDSGAPADALPSADEADDTAPEELGDSVHEAQNRGMRSLAPSIHECASINTPHSGTYPRPVKLDDTMSRGFSAAVTSIVFFKPSNMSLLHVMMIISLLLQRKGAAEGDLQAEGQERSPQSKTAWPRSCGWADDGAGVA